MRPPRAGDAPLTVTRRPGCPPPCPGLADTFRRPLAWRQCARLVAAVLALSVWGCASATPPPRPSARPFDDVRRLAIVVSGESSPTVIGHNAEPGRTFDEIMTWYPTQAWMRPVAKLVHQGINWALEYDQTTNIARASTASRPPRSSPRPWPGSSRRAAGSRRFRPSTASRRRGAAARRRRRARDGARLGARAGARRRPRSPGRLRRGARSHDAVGNRSHHVGGQQDVTSPEQFPPRRS